MKKELTNKKETYKIYCIYSEFVLCPDNAIEYRFYKRNPYDSFIFETTDDIFVDPEFIATWKILEGDSTSHFNCLTKTLWNRSFEQIRSLWISRLGSIGDYWHFIKLKKIEK